MLALFALLVLLASDPVSPISPPYMMPPDMTQTLRAKDQALLDAIAVGNRTVWDAALSTDAVYVDESGRILDRKALLDDIKPLPKGASGTLRITSYVVHQDGPTAIVIHHDDEREMFHSHALHAEYIMTETWLLRGDAWKLALVHSYVVPHDPPAIAVPPATLATYAGTYRAAPDLTLVLRRAGDHLTAATNGGPARIWRAETPDVFFVAGRQRIRYIFQRTAGGAIAGFADRREGRDMLWKRVAR